MGFDGLVLTHTAEGSRHMYKGQTTLDAPCDALGISTTLDATTRTAQVVMQTQRLPGATCEPKKSPYSFAFAVISDTNPAAVIVTLDGRTLPSKVIEQ